MKLTKIAGLFIVCTMFTAVCSYSVPPPADKDVGVTIVKEAIPAYAPMAYMPVLTYMPENSVHDITDSQATTDCANIGLHNYKTVSMTATYGHAILRRVHGSGNGYSITKVSGNYDVLHIDPGLSNC